MEPALESSLDFAELDDFIGTARGANFYHCSTWIEALRSIYGHSIGFFTCREGGELRALLPFADVPKLGLIHRQSLPFGTYGGPVLATGANADLATKLTLALRGSLGGRVQRVSLIGVPDPDAETLPQEGSGLRTQILDLRGGWEDVFAKSFRKERRRQIRKAERSGVTVERSTSETELAEYYEIYLEHARDWGLAEPTPLSHLNMLVADTERVRFWVARHEGEIIGGHLNLHFRGMVIAWNGTARKSKRALAPSILLYARNLEQACADGESFYNFGGSGANDPLFEFKAAFGAMPVVYASERWEGKLLAGSRRLLGRGD